MLSAPSAKATDAVRAARMGPASDAGGFRVPLADERVTVSSSGRARRRSSDAGSKLPGVLAELVAAWTAAGAVAFALQLAPAQLLAVLGVWYVAMAAMPSPTARRGSALLSVPVRAAAATVSVSAVGVAFLGLTSALLSQTISVLAAACVSVLTVRLLVRWHHGPTRVLVVGDEGAAESAYQRWSGSRDAVVVGVGIVDSETGAIGPAQQFPGAPAESSVDDLAAAVAAWRADVVLVTLGAGLGPAGVRRLAWQLEHSGAELAFMDAFESVAPHRISVNAVAGTTVVAVAPSRPGVVVRTAKALSDRLLGLVLLTMAAPLIAVMAIAVRLESPGGAIFRQVRVGQHGKTFTMYKMRTMRDDAELMKADLADINEADSVLFKIRRDPRVTRTGRLLRKSSLDELPQLLNVVRGHMSLVGPRPAVPSEVANYDEVARRRLAVRPGLTGLWQVSGRSDLDWDESVALDVQYADNLTFGGDLAICLRTVSAVARAKGAY